MKKYFIYSIVGLLTLFSCAEDEIKTFDTNDNIPSVYFQRLGKTNYNGDMTLITKREYADSASSTFVGQKLNILSMNVKMPICIAGNSPKKPIKLKFKINDKLTTAVEKVDFEVNLDTTYIKAGEITTSLVIKLLRTPKLSKQTLWIAVDLLDSEDYTIIEKYNDTDVWNDYAKILNGRTFRLSFSEIVTEPFYYEIFGVDFYGPWTSEKYNTLNLVMNWTIDDWGNAGKPGSKVASGVMGYAAFQLRNYLQEQANPPINNPIREADGTLMQLPGIYAVDYSRYE